MSSDTTEVFNVTNLSPKLVKVIIEKQNEKLKITNSVGLCVEELSEQTAIFGKAMSKVPFFLFNCPLSSEYLIMFFERLQQVTLYRSKATGSQHYLE